MGFCYPCFFTYLERRKEREGKLVTFLVTKVKKIWQEREGRENVYWFTVVEMYSIMVGWGGVVVVMVAGAARSYGNRSLFISR